MAPTKEKTKWEIAKPLLEEDYIKGEITDDMKPLEVATKRDEYGDCSNESHQNFSANFLRLKKNINANKARALQDADMLQMDMGVHTLAKYDVDSWHGSDAERFLKEDVKANRHLNLTPKEFRLTRIEYQRYSVEQIGDHLTQEIRSKRETPYWMMKKKKSSKPKSNPIKEDLFLEWCNANDVILTPRAESSDDE